MHGSSENVYGIQHIGAATCAITLQFLTTSTEHICSAFTFTELFAFNYFEIDSCLYRHKISSRGSIAESLNDAYLETIKHEFKPSDENEHLDILIRRIGEYGGMHRARKDKSDIVEQLQFYLIQASRLGKYISDDDCPIAITDAFENMNSQMELTKYYIGILAPFVEHIKNVYKTKI